MVDKKKLDCWIISSGLIGCENQCIGVAEELNLKYEIKRVNPSKLLSIIAPFGKPKKMKELILHIQKLLLEQAERLFHI